MIGGLFGVNYILSKHFIKTAWRRWNCKVVQYVYIYSVEEYVQWNLGWIGRIGGLKKGAIIEEILYIVYCRD